MIPGSSHFRAAVMHTPRPCLGLALLVLCLGLGGCADKEIVLDPEQPQDRRPDPIVEMVPQIGGLPEKHSSQKS